MRMRSAGELTNLGFTRAPDPTSAEIAVSVIVDRGSRPDPAPARRGRGLRHRRRFVRAPRGGFGGDVGTTVPVGGNSRAYIVGTRMQVQIKRRSDGIAIWEGRAMTEARAPAPPPRRSAAVAKLAHALFLGFPGESGRR